jgi:hypothetical protein
MTTPGSERADAEAKALVSAWLYAKGPAGRMGGLIDVIADLIHRRDADLARLQDAITWAMGAHPTDEFRPREPGEGAYWWRKELRERATPAGTEGGVA